jgi:hypothetical protein
VAWHLLFSKRNKASSAMRIVATLLVLGMSHLGLAACSNMPDQELITRAVQPQTIAAPASRVQAKVPVSRDDAGSDLSASSRSVRAEGRRSKDTTSELVRPNSPLASKSDDLKPWPKVGTKEWEDQQAKDRRRQQRLDEVTKICRDC